MRITWFDKAFWPYISTLGCAMSRKVAVALTLMVSLSLMEGVGLLMLVPLLGWWDWMCRKETWVELRGSSRRPSDLQEYIQA